MNSGDLTPIDLDILGHVGRYRISFREILEGLYFKSGGGRSVLDRLQKDGFVASRKGFGGNRVGYTLTRKATDRLALNHSRSVPAGSAAAVTHAAILSFCCLKHRPRILLEENELAELFDGKVPDGRHHCLEYGTQGRRVYHIYVPGSSLGPAKVIEHLVNKHLQRALSDPVLADWIDTRLYSLAVLVETPQRQDAIEKAVSSAVDGKSVPLSQRIRIHVEAVPMPGTVQFEEALRVVS